MLPAKFIGFEQCLTARHMRFVMNETHTGSNRIKDSLTQLMGKLLTYDGGGRAEPRQ